MSDLKITLVPRELYYHEVAYVRGLEAINAELRNAFEEIAEARFMEPWDACARHVYGIVGRITAKYPIEVKP